ncbi:hypothetical protein SCLCIDRAFT_1220170 [Scleroderma citrinum Foug A]|uniref:Uncharacterized protein n=1 Tax=Scleroderma citrinum Foug A TaxID=1036808 RepID=A0A0C3DK88_9AGAM|nr:hypothetical protein SCLCIDRAFT_1220170 [Scleroderma citrinum Foug A]
MSNLVISEQIRDPDHLSTVNSRSQQSIRRPSPTQKLLNTSLTPLAQQPNSSRIHALLPSKGPAKSVDPSSVATKPDNKEDEVVHTASLVDVSSLTQVQLLKEADKLKKLSHVGAPVEIMKSFVGGVGLQPMVTSLLWFPLIRLTISFRLGIAQIRGSFHGQERLSPIDPGQ